MKKINYIAGLILSVLVALMFTQSCAPSKMIAEKSGAQLWGENCIRCHNMPSPADFADAQWTTIGLHMEVRANLTHAEAEKIVDFMKSAN